MKRTRSLGLYPGMRTTSVLIAIAGLAISHRPVHAKACVTETGAPRWTNYIGPCDVASTFCQNGSPLPLSQGQQRLLYSTRYADTAADACRLLIAKTNFGAVTQAQRDSWRLVSYQKPNPYMLMTSYKCTYDVNGDGKVGGIVRGPAGWVEGSTPGIYNDFSAAHLMIDVITSPTEDMCDRVPWGPNKDVSFGTNTVTPGRVFSQPQKDLILAQAEAPPPFTGQYGSQADELHYPFTLKPIEPYPILDKSPPTPWYARPEVDHIIPRVDIHGCACGPNSPANALVVSGLLNRLMSNFSENEARQIILEAFTKPPGFAKNATAEDLGDPADTAELDEEANPEEVGCSAGGGGHSLAMIVLGLGLCVRRRMRGHDCRWGSAG